MSRSPLRLRSLPALAWRNLAQHRARTALSVLAVAAGVASVVGTNVLNRAILAAIGSSPDTQAITSGLMTQLETSLLGAGVAIALAAGFLVLNAFLMSVTQRRQQLGVLRALGMPRRMLLQLIVMEALIVAGVGSPLGLGAGPLLAGLIGQLLRETTVNAFAPQAPSLAVLAAATGLGVGVAVAAGLVPAVQAMRTSPLEALRDQPAAAAPKPRSRRRRQTQAGLIAGAALWTYLIAAPPARWVWSPLSWWLLGLADLLWAVCVALLLPGLIGAIGRLARRLLPGAMGRLTADNLRRSRGRVTLTAAGMATGLALITGMTGFFAFFFGDLMGTSLERLNDPHAMLLTSFEFTQGLGGYANLDSLRLPEGAVEVVRRAVGERAEVVPFHFTMVPELGFLTADYFSMIADPEPLSRTGETLFRFAEGDWQRALPVLEAGCGVLITPMVADMNGAGLYDRINVTGIDGPVACTVAGIGQPMGGATFISGAARDRFVLGDPINALVMPSPETRLDPSALARLEADIQAVAAQQGIFATGLDVLVGTLLQTGDTVLKMVNGVLLVMLLLAALGVVNTTLISVTERRHELGLLRAVGATRRQVSRLIVGEAALTGIAGGLLGLVAGLGLTVAAVLVFGGRAFGLPDLDLWAAAAEAALPALRNGIFGLLAAPAICALAAGTAARRLVPPAAVRMMVAGHSLGEGRRRGRETDSPTR